MRSIWVKIRTTKAERVEWKAKADAAGVSLSDLVRQALGRVRTWTTIHAEIEREKNREIAKIGNNLNQIARYCNTHKEAAETVEVVAHLCVIEREIAALSYRCGQQKEDGVASKHAH